MAETVLGLVHGALNSLWTEANQASDNKDALLGLAAKAREVIQPQLSVVHSRMAGVADKRHLKGALSQLHMTLQHVQGIVIRRGGKRSTLMLPLDALGGRGAKVRAEIQGAELNLMHSMQAVMVGLQIQAVGVMEDLRRRFDGAVEILEGAAAGSADAQGQPYAWSLNYSDLEYKKTKRGKPSDDVVLGSGGFGVVFKALYQGKVEVAVKEPHNPSDIHSDVGLRKSFFREADNLHRLQHRNVVEFVGAVALDEDGDTCYMLVFEVLPQTLERYIKSVGSVNAEKKMELILGMAEGLAYLHSMNIVHRDIKPLNIMIDTEGTPKYIDFGLSKEKETLQVSKASTRMAGTEGWMSPEKKMGGNSSPASDVFSFGLVAVYVLLGGQKPAQSQSEREQNVKSGYGDDLCSRLVLCCTAEKAEKRPTSATLATSLLINVDVFNVPTAQPVPSVNVQSPTAQPVQPVPSVNVQSHHIVQEFTLTGHSGSVWSVAYSPDGKHIVSGSDDRTVKVWDSQTGKEVNVLFCHRPYRLLLRALC